MQAAPPTPENQDKGSSNQQLEHSDEDVAEAQSKAVSQLIELLYFAHVRRDPCWKLAHCTSSWPVLEGLVQTPSYTANTSMLHFWLCISSAPHLEAPCLNCLGIWQECLQPVPDTVPLL